MSSPKPDWTEEELKTFVRYVITNNPEILSEFDRLRGTNLCMRGTSLDIQIDLMSGRLEHDAKLFAEFLKECVWDRLPKEAKDAL